MTTKSNRLLLCLILAGLTASWAVAHWLWGIRCGRTWRGSDRRTGPICLMCLRSLRFTKRPAEAVSKLTGIVGARVIRYHGSAGTVLAVGENRLEYRRNCTLTEALSG